MTATPPSEIEWAQLLIEVVGYFAVWSVLIVAVLEAYARCLEQAARFPRFVRDVLAFGIYIVVACILVLPLIGPTVKDEWHSTVQSNSAFAILFLAFYLASAVPGICIFKKRKLERLRRLGFFKVRRW